MTAGPVKLAAAFLLLPILPAAAAASGIAELETERKRYPSRLACEKALKARYAAAAARLEARAPEERRGSKVEPPYRDDDGRLAFDELLDLTVETPQMTMPSSQSDEYSCRGRVLEHRSYLEGGSFLFIPPPPPPPAPEPRQP